MQYKGYTARVEFDADAGVLYGEVEGVKDVITFEATSVDELQQTFRDSVDDYLAMCAERGEEPDKPYSGKFVVRLDPSLHRELAREAAKHGASLNSFAVQAMRYWMKRFARGSDQPNPRRARAVREQSAGETYMREAAATMSEPLGIANVWTGAKGGARAQTPPVQASKTPPFRGGVVITSDN